MLYVYLCWNFSGITNFFNNGKLNFSWLNNTKWKIKKSWPASRPWMINSKSECNLLSSEISANIVVDNSSKSRRLGSSSTTPRCDEHRCSSIKTMIVLLIVGVCFSVMCKSFYVTSLPFVFRWSILLTSRVIAGSHPHLILFAVPSLMVMYQPQIPRAQPLCFSWCRACHNMQIFVEISITVLKRLHLSDRKKIYVCQYLFMVCCQIFLDGTKIYIACIYYLVGVTDNVSNMKY